LNLKIGRLVLLPCVQNYAISVRDRPSIRTLGNSIEFYGFKVAREKARIHRGIHRGRERERVEEQKARNA